jgi:hypothetical protein
MVSMQKDNFQLRELRVPFNLLILSMFKNLRQHFGTLGVIGDERGEILDVRVA